MLTIRLKAQYSHTAQQRIIKYLKEKIDTWERAFDRPLLLKLLVPFLGLLSSLICVENAYAGGCISPYVCESSVDCSGSVYNDCSNGCKKHDASPKNCTSQACENPSTGQEALGVSCCCKDNFTGETQCNNSCNVQ